MSTIAKKAIVEEVTKSLSANEMVFFVDFTGVSVAAERLLRRELRDKSARLKVAKARLIKIALNSLGLMDENPELNSLVGGQVAMVFSPSESQVVAKSLFLFQKQLGLDAFVSGGLYKNSICDKAKVKGFAKLPTKLALVQTLAFVLNYPVTLFAMAVKEVAGKTK